MANLYPPITKWWCGGRYIIQHTKVVRGAHCTPDHDSNASHASAMLFPCCPTLSQRFLSRPNAVPRLSYPRDTPRDFVHQPSKTSSVWSLASWLILLVRPVLALGGLAARRPGVSLGGRGRSCSLRPGPPIVVSLRHHHPVVDKFDWSHYPETRVHPLGSRPWTCMWLCSMDDYAQGDYCARRTNMNMNAL